MQQHTSQQPERINGKVVLSVGAALRNSVFCPRLVLGLSSFVLLLSLQWLCDALVMSSSLSILLCCLCQDLFQAEGFSKDLAKHIPQHVLFIGS